MASENSVGELQIFNKIIAALSGLEKETQTRLLKTIITFLQIENFRADSGGALSEVSFRSGSKALPETAFSDREEMPPKDFILEKDPGSEKERMACLGYYLTHYRGTQHFKTVDLSKLNTEAAQKKLSNAAQSVKTAVEAGLLVPSTKGRWQLSAIGEQFVQALPDWQAGKEVIARWKPRRPKKTTGKAGKNEVNTPKQK